MKVGGHVNLQADQKIFLRQYIDDERSSVSVWISDGVASSLQAMKVIVRTSAMSQPGGYFPFALQPWARDILTQNRQILD